MLKQPLIELVQEMGPEAEGRRGRAEEGVVAKKAGLNSYTDLRLFKTISSLIR